MSDLQRLSRQLYEVLEDVGASETLRQMHQQSATEVEILYTIDIKYVPECNTYIHVCGSSYEGSVTPDLVRDTDIIHCLCESPVVLDPASIPHGESLLMIKEDWSYPGYVKLQIVVNGRPLTERDRRRIEDTRYDVIGRLCFEHLALGNMHGPASMNIDEDGEHFLDNVFAFKCDHIPDHANEWIFRQRNHGWPTAEQIQAMSKMGCMFVSVGHWESQERDLEWRLSFSLQERLLMSSLNPVQHKVYIVLKMIKNNILGRIIECESLSSYHCKTCIFHAVEGTPADFWITDNLINCILYCLRLLLQWVRVGNCPNYFIKDQNLFSKEGFMSVRHQVRNMLRKLVKMKHHFLYLLECDSIGSLMRGGDVQWIRAVTGAMLFEHMINLKQFVITYNMNTLYSILHKSKDLSYTLGELQSTDSINDHPKHVTQPVINYLQPWLHLHIAKSLVARAIDTEDRHRADMLLRRADEHFHCTSRTDVSSVRFAKASILYTYGKYEECRKLLLAIESDLTFQVLSYCPCRNRTFWYVKDEQQRRDLTELMSQMPLTSIVKHHQAHCVVFTRSESRITPTALQYEMYRSLDTELGSRDDDKDLWFHFAVVDARVYLYFLQYLVYEALHMDVHRQVALDNIKAHIEKYNLGHEDTAYNLLGWIYLQQNHVADARHCFTESLKIRPDHNAAKFHLEQLN